ncbi:DNA methyltransferase [Paracidovorax avenae]|uniref:DNA methyltransferase n=1 Tax=Paracidovorax avenae TaxID=80867 RepID=UPI0006B36A86|nr:DNA methyltransferase [Paracidovorax avenae]
MSDLFQNHVAKSGPVECLGKTFPSDEARREHYLKLLAEKLKDPAFRKIEGFPIGSDEDILALSDPPFYTACPNPFIEELIRNAGKTYDPSINYDKDPLSVDVTEGKSHALYNAHTYHTKVPHRAIMRYMLHYTEPGDVVLDAFCGTGMTGVAAAACGSAGEVRDLGFTVKGNQAFDSEGRAHSIGARKAILMDLSPIATFIASNLNNMPSAVDLNEAGQSIISEVSGLEKELYSSLDKNGNFRGLVNYVVWSDVYICEECACEYDYWSQAVELGSGEAKKTFSCPGCGATQNTRNLTRAYESYFDPILNHPVTQMKQTPVFINYFDNKGKKKKAELTQHDIQYATTMPSLDGIKGLIGAVELPKGDRYRRDAFEDRKVTHVHHFYTWRNLKAIFSLVGAIRNSNFNDDIKRGLLFVVTSFADRNGTKRNRFVINEHNPSGRVNGPMANTFYLPNLFCEMNIFELFREKLKDVLSACAARFAGTRNFIGTSSSTEIPIPDNSIDYIFTDPPFGHNIQYSELNQPLEAIVRVFSKGKDDIVVNEVAEKDINFYKTGVRQAFSQYYRVLKPGRWITVEFSNTKAGIWNSLQTALTEAGFVIASVAALDKTRGGMHAMIGVTAVKQDLIITAYKPGGDFELKVSSRGGTQESVWDFVAMHLSHLPVVKVKSRNLEFIAERDPRILFDRMVAWFVQRNLPVPMSSQEFQAGLIQRFVDRDGMIFLPDQVSEYDKKRLQVAIAPQMEMFVSDERSAIDWLSDFLKRRPSTYQEITPEFMGQLGAGWKKHETKPELSALLEDNFLKYDGTGEVPSQIHGYLSSNHKDLRGLDKSAPALVSKAKDRWYVPDPNKAQDLEKKREKALLKEFEAYRSFTGRKIKESRLEVLRAGFRAAWASKDYATIISIAKKLPEETLQEDEKLLTLYDLALTRTEDGI